MKEDIINLSVRATPVLLGLFERAKIIRPINRNALFQEAVEYTLLNTETDWQSLAKAAMFEYNIRSSEPGPDLIQLRVAKTQWDAIIGSINKAFTPTLKRIYASYSIKLVMINYIRYLEQLNAKETRKEPPLPETNELGAPEIAYLIAKIIVENSPALDDIKTIIKKYKQGDYQ